MSRHGLARSAAATVLIALAPVLAATSARAQKAERQAPPTRQQAASGQRAVQSRGMRSARSPERATLEARVLERFVDISARQMRLNARQRSRLANLVRRGAVRRRELAREAAVARRDLLQAVRTGKASDADYARMLARLDSVRASEQTLAQTEDRELRQFLTPRQRALFLVLRARLNQRIMRLRQAAGGG